MKVILDTNVIYSALYSKNGASYQVLTVVSERVALAKMMSRLNKSTNKMSPNDLLAFLDKNVSNNKPLNQDKM
ncbi:hypothetical protein [Cysteiniphilum litorale]|uniref:hypothetical protein n=1 Tax=Cysteiniphilum litorale TaxID=2056700 RepID=UPI003F880E7A